MANQNLDIVVRVRGGQVASQEVRQVGGAVESVGAQTEQTNKKTSALAGQLKSLATGFAVYKGYQFIKGAISQTTSLAKATAGLQRVTGLDSQTAAGWVATAEERGIQSKQLNQGFISLARGIQGAANGSKAGKQAFSQLGLDAANLKVLDTRTQLGMIADSFKALPAGVDKAALAQKLFGRQAQGMLPLLDQGAKGLNEQIGAMAKHVGMTGKTKKGAMDLVKQQRELNASMTGFKVAVGTALVPLLVSITTALAPLLEQFGNLIRSSPAFRLACLAIAAGLTAIKVAMFFGAGAGTATIIGLVVAAAVGLVIAYNKIKWFRDAVNAVWGAIKDAAVSAFNFVKNHWALLLTLMTLGLAGPVIFIIKHFGEIKNAASDAFNWIKGAIGTVAGAITSVLGGAFKVVKGIVGDLTGAINGMINTIKSIAHLPGKAWGLIKGAASHIPGVSLLTGQSGGTVPSGPSRMTLVGEAGPELVSLPGGSHVIPNHVLSGFGGGAHVTVPVYLDRRQIALAMGDFTADQQASR